MGLERPARVAGPWPCPLPLSGPKWARALCAGHSDLAEVRAPQWSPKGSRSRHQHAERVLAPRAWAVAPAVTLLQGTHSLVSGRGERQNIKANVY